MRMWLVALLVVGVGCDRAAEPTTVPAPAAVAASRPAVAGGVVRVGGREVRLPPATLRLLADGALLTADADDADGFGATLSLPTKPERDAGGTKWTTATWVFRYSESQDADEASGLVLAGEDAPYRPVIGRLLFTRDGDRGTVTFDATFARPDPGDASKPAQRFAVTGTLDVAVEEAGRAVESPR